MYPEMQLNAVFSLYISGALKNQVQHFWEIMLHGKNLRAIEY
jgi:hypothetical protein